MFMKKTLLSIMILSGMYLTTAAQAETVQADPIDNAASVVKVQSDDHSELRDKIKTYFGNKDVVSNIAEAPLPNAYLVSLDDGTSFVYFKDSDYAVLGDIYDLKDKSNITPELKADFYKKILEKYPLTSGIKYKPTVPVIGKAYVFTDPTCGFCRKVHDEMQTYLDQGIEIVYIPYPRSGLNGEGHDELVSVFNAGDEDAQKKAMDLAKQDRAAEIKSLPTYKENPNSLKLVDEGVQIGRELGIRGTPSIYLENGYNIPGYIEADKLAAAIKAQKSK